MDEPMRKSGQYPNVAIEAGSDPKEVMEKYSEDTRDHSKAECQHSNVSQSLSDTREQLEQDIIAFVTWFDNMEDGREVPIKVEADYSTVINWLDRQAAIAKREAQAECDQLADERYRYKLQCERWEAKIVELEAERNLWLERFMQTHRHAMELIAERDRLQKVVQIQADSFQKLERELKEALDGQAT